MTSKTIPQWILDLDSNQLRSKTNDVLNGSGWEIGYVYEEPGASLYYHSSKGGAPPAVMIQLADNKVWPWVWYNNTEQGYMDRVILGCGASESLNGAITDACRFILADRCLIKDVAVEAAPKLGLTPDGKWLQHESTKPGLGSASGYIRCRSITKVNPCAEGGSYVYTGEGGPRHLPHTPEVIMGLLHRA